MLQKNPDIYFRQVCIGVDLRIQLTCDVLRMEWNAMKLLALTAYCGKPASVSPNLVSLRQSLYAACPATGQTSPGLSSTNHLEKLHDAMYSDKSTF